MGTAVLLARLTRHGVRRHAAESLMLGAALVVAALSLTLGLTLHGSTTAPYAHTRALTRGPDVVVGVLPEPHRFLSGPQHHWLTELLRDPAVARSSGPFPTTWAPLRSGHVHGAVEVQGRDAGPAAVDRPAVTTGTWVRPGAVVLERAFAEALQARVGATVHIGGRPFQVSGIAATAAATPYPNVCYLGCIRDTPALATAQPGLAWTTRSDARSLATRTEPVALTAYLSLRPGMDAGGFVATHTSTSSPAAPLLTSWRDIERHDDKAVRNVRAVLLLGGSLLSLLAIATVAVLVGGRVAQETRRVGTLKAVGATPGFVMAALLTEYVAIAVAATAVGVVLSRALAPHLAAPSAGLLGSTAPTPTGPGTIGTVLAIIVGLTVLSTVGAAVRAVRSSTVSALTDLGQQPRRHRALIAVSARLPVAGLLGLRLLARRPRRSLLSAAGIAVADCGVAVVLLAGARLGAEHGRLAGGVPDPEAARLAEVMFTVTVLIAVLSLVDVVFVAAATATDAQASLATVQALGATAGANLGALGVALGLPAALGAAVGLPVGIELYSVLDHSDTASPVPVLGLVAVAPATVVVAAVLAAGTSHLKGRRPLSERLQAAAR